MEILAHRGFWTSPEEKNTLLSMERAFRSGLGVETDLRDYRGRLVISHNVADETSPDAEEMFRLYRRSGCAGTLALNVKADGIQVLIKPLLEKYGIDRYFLFDMSVPELVVNEREKLLFYTRHSDVEHECVMYEQAGGVWLDSFYDEQWLTKEIIQQHLGKNKKMCIVSPELHGYNYKAVWAMLKENGYHHSELVMLCTDVPDKAKEYFYGKD